MLGRNIIIMINKLLPEPVVTKKYTVCCNWMGNHRMQQDKLTYDMLLAYLQIVASTEIIDF